jgi:hypothetical protein
MESPSLRAPVMVTNREVESAAKYYRETTGPFLIVDATGIGKQVFDHLKD